MKSADSGDVKSCKTIKTTKEQDATMQSKIDAIAKNPGTYTFTGNNCVNFVRSVLKSVNIPTSSSFKPKQFLTDTNGTHE